MLNMSETVKCVSVCLSEKDSFWDKTLTCGVFVALSEYSVSVVAVTLCL